MGSLAGAHSHGFCISSSRPHRSRAEPLGRYGSHAETQGRETCGYVFMSGGVWGFLNLLFKHSVNIHKAHILKIIYYYFLLIIGTTVALPHGK